MTKEAAKAFEAAQQIAALLDPLPADQRRVVLKWMGEVYGVGITPTPLTAPVNPPPLAPPPEFPTPSTGGTDIKTFLTAKNPTSDNQLATAVAYYYRFEAPTELRKDAIGSDDLQEACRLSGRERLGDPGKTLRNARDYGYLDTAERGQYTVNTVGENLVAVTLPSDAPSPQRKRPTKKAARKKSKAKKTNKKATKKRTSKKKGT